MTPEEAPVGSIIVIGHPANNRTARKSDNGWYLLHNGVRLADDSDEFRMANLVHNPK